MNLHLSFHTTLILIYTIPNIYVFLRLWNVFINRKDRLRFTIIYLLFASIYPFSVYLPENNFLSDFLERISGFLLPFFLYLFLFTLLSDILLLLNKFIKVLSPEKRRSPEFRKYGLSMLIFLSGIVVVAGIINFNTIRISEYDIEVPARSSSIRNLKIAFTADFHLGEKTSVRFVEKFSGKISDINPDILLFGGDIAEGHDGGEKMVVFEKILRDINPRYGFFTVLGNHEYYSGHENGSFFNKAGIEVLYDSVAVINNEFNLAGRLDAHSRTRKTVGELLKSADSTLPVILIDHRPTAILEVSNTQTDVQFSGHTHNGQLFPINFFTSQLYELTWGYKMIRNTHFFVTSGIRLWGPPVRTIGKSEIMVININFSDRL